MINSLITEAVLKSWRNKKESGRETQRRGEEMRQNRVQEVMPCIVNESSCLLDLKG